MLSNLASYIFGSSKGTTEEEPKAHDAIKGAEEAKEDDWVIVGGDDKPLLTLGSLCEAAPRLSVSSAGSSEASSEEDMVVVVEDQQPQPSLALANKSTRRLVSCANGVTQLKAMRSSQKNKQKESSKQLTAKATERRNKAVKNHGSSKRSKAAANLAIRSCGINKQLKQC